MRSIYVYIYHDSKYDVIEVFSSLEKAQAFAQDSQGGEKLIWDWREPIYWSAAEDLSIRKRLIDRWM
jgi:hypothetical protein